MALNKQFETYAKPLIQSEKLQQIEHFTQHGETSCLLHSIAVAYYSLLFVDVFRIQCNHQSLVKGALLHDYFLYDWHEKDDSHRLHGFTHPKAALINAMEDFRLNSMERNIILRHMFPLTPIPPRCIEGVIVCLVDKACSVYETFSTRPYHELKEMYQ